jgi:preprotein translocase subunit SecA
MAEQWDISGLEQALASEFLLECPIQQWLDADERLDEHGLRDRIVEVANQAYEAKVAMAGNDNMRQFERSMLLQSLDSHWREHLAAMDHLRQGIHLRGYAAKNPKQEYKREAFELFERMLETIAHEITQVTMTVQIRSEADVEAVEPQENLSNVRYQHADYDTALAPDAEAEAPSGQQPIERQYAKVGRNDLCPCGSGKKYKHCHGKLA